MNSNSEQASTYILKKVLDCQALNGQKKFHTILELQITSKYLDIKKLTGKKRVRIDLCIYNGENGSIHFVETESQLYIRHALDFIPFCDYMYLCVPESSFQRSQQTNQETTEQIQWAEREGIGVFSVSPPDNVRILVKAQQQKQITPLVRAEVYRFLRGRGIPIHSKTE